MKKNLYVLFAAVMVAAQMMAVSVEDVSGQYYGDLNIGGSLYPGKSVYLLPGVVDSTVTFVLPDFVFNAGKLGNIVLPNIPMNADGMLMLENATLYLDSISERATITVINGLEDAGTTYNSVVTATDAMVVLSIAAPSLPEQIFVLFVGNAVKDKNYQLTNGAFEGTWTNYEPEGWHSFYSATGLMVDFIKNNYQFIQSSDVRPGSKGTHSAMLSSTMALGVKANGNCTNGQINAGSSTASDAAGNYNFSDPANTGFNTAFHGRPDSLVFWAKYLPADRNSANEVNRARVSAVITTDARYQDPEEADNYADVKIGAAMLNYAATTNMGWQRLAVPFEYYDNDNQPAYILTTFTTNMLPGGGSSFSQGTINKVNVLDTVYLDDVELVYNKTLASFERDADKLQFNGHVATLTDTYCDDCAKYAAVSNGLSAQAFIAFDNTHKCIFVYVIADDYAGTGEYEIYRIDFADSETDDLDPIDSAVENVKDNEGRFEKVIINGQLFIRKGDILYNATGIRL